MSASAPFDRSPAERVTPLEHIRHLSRDIGPRGSTTDAEAEAAAYVVRALEGLDLAVRQESFESARSGWWPFALASGLMLLAVPLTWLGTLGSSVAAALYAAVMLSLVLELSFRANPLRWVLPRWASQNVWTRIAPEGPVERRIVLVGHLDSHRTPVAFRSRTWIRIFGGLMPAGFISAAVLFAIALLPLVDLTPPAPWVTVLAALPLVAVTAITLQADTTPYTEGANDNASAVAVLLSLAQQLAAQPTKRTEVWLLFSGCEEVGCYGADAFLKANIDALSPIDDPRPVAWVTIDSVAGDGSELCVLETHRFFTNARSDNQLLSLAEAIGERDESLTARRTSMVHGYTESHVAQKYRLRHITLIALDEHDLIPNWHRPSDTVEHIDEALLARTTRFAHQLLTAWDAAD